MNQKLSIPGSKQRILSIDGVINFRDLGGYPTADGREVSWGKVYRSAQLDSLSDAGVSDMADLGIKTVVDLRFDDETKLFPTITAAFPQADIIAWQDSPKSDQQDRGDKMKRAWRESLESHDPNQVREAMRVNYPKKLYSHAAIYRSMLLRIIEGDTPLVFHCAAGKDRTGVAAALILSLVGVSDEQIVEDYLLTQTATKGLLEAFHAAGATGPDDNQNFQRRLASYPKHVIEPVFDADEAYIRTLMDYVNERYGGFQAYAKQKLELTESHIQQLVNSLLV